jgi:hypothetical protein
MFIAGGISVLLYSFRDVNAPMLFGAGLALALLSILVSEFIGESSAVTKGSSFDHKNE